MKPDTFKEKYHFKNDTPCCLKCKHCNYNYVDWDDWDDDDPGSQWHSCELMKYGLEETLHNPNHSICDKFEEK